VRGAKSGNDKDDWLLRKKVRKKICRRGRRRKGGTSEVGAHAGKIGKKSTPTKLEGGGR